MKSVLFALACFLSSPCLAQEYRPYPSASITPDQWKSYLAQVKLKVGASEERHETEKIVFFRDSTTSWAFTIEGNPAHPAWVTRLFTERDGAVYVQQIGYFAGDEAAFAKLFQAFKSGIDMSREKFWSTPQ